MTGDRAGPVMRRRHGDHETQREPVAAGHVPARPGREAQRQVRGAVLLQLARRVAGGGGRSRAGSSWPPTAWAWARADASSASASGSASEAGSATARRRTGTTGRRSGRRGCRPGRGSTARRHRRTRSSPAPGCCSSPCRTAAPGRSTGPGARSPTASSSAGRPGSSQLNQIAPSGPRAMATRVRAAAVSVAGHRVDLRRGTEVGQRVARLRPGGVDRVDRRPAVAVVDAAAGVLGERARIGAGADRVERAPDAGLEPQLAAAGRDRGRTHPKPALSESANGTGVLLTRPPAVSSRAWDVSWPPTTTSLSSVEYTLPSGPGPSRPARVGGRHRKVWIVAARAAPDSDSTTASATGATRRSDGRVPVTHTAAMRPIFRWP